MDQDAASLNLPLEAHVNMQARFQVMKAHSLYCRLTNTLTALLLPLLLF